MTKTNTVWLDHYKSSRRKWEIHGEKKHLRTCTNKTDIHGIAQNSLSQNYFGRLYTQRNDQKMYNYRLNHIWHSYPKHLLPSLQLHLAILKLKCRPCRGGPICTRLWWKCDSPVEISSSRCWYEYELRPTVCTFTTMKHYMSASCISVIVQGRWTQILLVPTAWSYHLI